MTTLIDLGKLRFHFAGDYASGTFYELNDVVKYGGNVYVYTNPVKASGNLPTSTSYWALMVEGFDFQGAYSNVTAYKIGQIVTYGARVYVAILDTTGNLPTNGTYWSILADGIQSEGEYSAVASYQPNDMVYYGPSLYIALQATTGNAPSNATYWQRIVEGVSASGIYNGATAYNAGDLVAYGGNIYSALQDTTGNLPTNATYWVLFHTGIRSRGNWTTTTAYLMDDVVTYGGSSYICLVGHTSATFATDLSSAKWLKYNSGIRWRSTWVTATAYLVDDIVFASESSYICVEDHTSAALFATDEVAGKWQVLTLGTGSLPSGINHANHILHSDGTATGGFWGYKTPIFTVKTTTYTAVAGEALLADTSTASFTITLPITPANNDSVYISDARGTFDAKPLTIARNGSSIQRLAEDMVVDTKGASFALVYNSTIASWLIL